jgi:hypothetical protein
LVVTAWVSMRHQTVQLGRAYLAPLGCSCCLVARALAHTLGVDLEPATTYGTAGRAQYTTASSSLPIEVHVDGWATGLIELGSEPRGPLRWVGPIAFANLPDRRLSAIVGEPFFRGDDSIVEHGAEVLFRR